MGAIVIIVILLAVVFIIIPLAIYNKVSDVHISVKNLAEKLNKVTDELNALKHRSFDTKKQEEKPGFITKEEQSPVETPPSFVIITPPVKEEIKEEPAPKPVPKPVPDSKPEPVLEKSFASSYEEVDERAFTEEKKQPKKSRDIERFIGENLANKIGIAVLVLGIAFFVKYAIDKNWINETGRVIIGLICGGILLGFAHYFRNSYRSFSSVLVGGGLTVFYFTIAFAFHQYHLISQQAAFIIMVIISAFAVLLSLYYKRQELAILATIGGFITPFLVNTGQDNYVALFTYLCILNTGLMVLAWFKRWPAINIIALVFTTFIYGGWLINRTYINDSLPYKDAFLFATLFYILFVIMNVVNSLRMHRKFAAFDYIIVLSTNFLYYAAGLAALESSSNENHKGIFTASLGIVNLILAAVFYSKKNVDRNFVSLLIGLAITFISLTAPVHFEGNHIVLFWAAEMVVLFWLYQRSKIRQLKVASLIVTVLMLGSLLLTWTEVYLSGTPVIPVILNKGFITTLVAAIALFIYYTLLRKEEDEIYAGSIANKPLRDAVLTASIIIAYIAGVLEIYYQFASRFEGMYIYIVYIQAYSFAVSIVLLKVFRRSASYTLLKFMLTALCLGLYLFNLRNNYQVSMDLLMDNEGVLFSAHWIAAVLLLWLLYDLVRFFFKEKNENPIAIGWDAYKSPFTWIAAASTIVVLSVEMYQVILWTNYRDLEDWVWWENLYYKAGLTILWGICSFTMMWLGMKHSFRTLRIISLTLFTITLVKLFIYDIRRVPPGGKIAAFILLGVLLLIVSFMYQRLKKIIIDNKPE